MPEMGNTQDCAARNPAIDLRAGEGELEYI